MSGPVYGNGNRPKRLEGWEQIAGHFGKRARTVQGWERKSGLPIRRDGSGVYAYIDELDAWQRRREIPPRAIPLPVEAESSIHTPDAPEPLTAQATRTTDGVILGADGSNLGGQAGAQTRTTPSGPRRIWATVLLIAGTLGLAYWVHWKPRVSSVPLPDLPNRPPVPRLFAKASSESGQPVSIPVPEAFHEIVLSPDSKRAYLVLQATRKIGVVEIATLKIEIWQSPVDVRSLAVSPDGTRLLVGSFADGLVQMDSRTGRVLDQLETGGAVADIAMSPDGRRVYLAMMHRGVRRYSLETHEWKQITTLGCPYYCSIDSGGTKLVISYQCGGPTGKSGHDAVEVFDLLSEKRLLVYSGVPLVGLRHTFFPDGDRIWLNGGDACSRNVYDREGCPEELSQIHHILRVSDGHILRSIPLPLNYGFWPILFAQGERVLVGSTNELAVLETSRFAAVESYRYPSAHIASDAVFVNDGQKVLLTMPSRKELVVINADGYGCDSLGSGSVHRFSGDGTEHDAIENAYVRQPLGYAPGLVGQAFKFDGNERAFIRSSSDFRLGASDSTVALYVKAADNADTTLLEVGNATEYWRLTGGRSGIEFRFKTGSDPPMSVRTDRRFVSGEWTHLAVTQADHEAILFVNGSPVSRINRTPGGSRLNPGFNEYAFGWSTIAGNHFRGLIDELVVWSRALSREEIRDIYMRRREPRCKL